MSRLETRIAKLEAGSADEQWPDWLIELHRMQGLPIDGPPPFRTLEALVADANKPVPKADA